MSALNSLKEKTVLLRTGSRPRTLFNLRTNMNKKSSLLDSVSALKQKGLTVALCQWEMLLVFRWLWAVLNGTVFQLYVIVDESYSKFRIPQDGLTWSPAVIMTLSRQITCTKNILQSRIASILQRALAEKVNTRRCIRLDFNRIKCTTKSKLPF